MMKYKYLILFVFGLLIHACDDITDKDSPEDNEGSNTETGTAGIYVLSEGLFNLNNSTLMFHSLKNGQTALIISAVKTIEDWAIPPMIWLFTAVSSIS